MFKKQITIIDVCNEKYRHEVVNMSFLMMLSDHYESICYLAKKSSIENIQKLLNECNFQTDNIEFRSRNFSYIKFFAKFAIFNSIMESFWNLWSYIFYSKKSDVFFNNNPLFAILFFHLISKFSSRKIFILCHSELEILPLKNAKRTNKIMQIYFKFIFCKLNLSKNIHFILLSENSREYFKTLINPCNKEQIHSIEHPRIRPEIDFDGRKISTYDKKVGIISDINTFRGLDNLNKLLSKIQFQNLNIYAISRINGNNFPCNNFILLNKNRVNIDNKEYTAYIKQMDATLFIYNVGSYKLTVSGSVLESVWHLKPIIALKNEYFSYLFNRYGEMGTLCNSIDEIIDVLNNFDVFYSRKELYIQNMRKAREILLPKNQSKELAKILEYVRGNKQFMKGI
jgi:hypothetical protein